MDEIVELFSPDIIGTPQGDIDVARVVNIWRLALQDPAKPGYFFAVRLAVAVASGFVATAEATLADLSLDALQEQAATPLRKEAAELRNKLATLRASAASTSDPSALWQGVVVPLLWKGLMYRAASLLNQVHSLRPGEVTYRWGGFEWTGPEHDWLEYQTPAWSVGRISVWGYTQMQTAAPDEAATVRDRLLATLDVINRTAKTIVQAAKSTGWGLGELVAAVVLFFAVKEL